MKIPLFQFWNTDDVPDEINDCMNTWKSNSRFDYRLYNSNSAEQYISENIGKRASHFYRKCAVPAMQADFFRYCAIYFEGGIYIDADVERRGDLSDLIDKSDRGILMSRGPRIANDFLFVRKPQDILFRYCINKSILNIENKISNNVWEVTGPGIMTFLSRTKTGAAFFKEMAILKEEEVAKYLNFNGDFDYKKSDSDWRNFLKPGSPSIFSD